MPMNTTLERRRGLASRMATATCSTISPADMWRRKPACPVAQNWQAMAQPAWVETQTVTRSGYAMRTDSTRLPSASAHNHLVVSPPSAVRRESRVATAGARRPAGRGGVPVARSSPPAAAPADADRPRPVGTGRRARPGGARSARLATVRKARAPSHSRCCGAPTRRRHARHAPPGRRRNPTVAPTSRRPGRVTRGPGSTSPRP